MHGMERTGEQQTSEPEGAGNRAYDISNYGIFVITLCCNIIIVRSQWAWDRYAARYSWAICAVTCPLVLQIYVVLAFLVVGHEKSPHYVEAAVVTIVALPILLYVLFLRGLGRLRLVERWAAGQEVDRARALEATYTYL